MTWITGSFVSGGGGRLKVSTNDKVVVLNVTVTVWSGSIIAIDTQT